ncbi:MAG: nicotinamide-nucleotide adenylyltransferase [Thermoplasmata archaeon]
MRAIFPGRFQPFHKGHLFAIEKILNECDSVIIVIENADESYTFKNPMTAGERFEAIIETFKNLSVSSLNIIIAPMENIPNNANWVNYLKNMLPKFDVCYSNNELVKMLMENGDIEVKSIEFKKREDYQGSEIRQRIAKGLPWKDLVPESVYNYIIDKRIDLRIKNLYGVV